MLCLCVCLPDKTGTPLDQGSPVTFEYLVEDSDVIELSVCCINGQIGWYKGEKNIKYSPILLTCVVLV